MQALAGRWQRCGYGHEQLDGIFKKLIHGLTPARQRRKRQLLRLEVLQTEGLKVKLLQLKALQLEVLELEVPELEVLDEPVKAAFLTDLSTLFDPPAVEHHDRYGEAAIACPPPSRRPVGPALLFKRSVTQEGDQALAW